MCECDLDETSSKAIPCPKCDPCGGVGLCRHPEDCLGEMDETAEMLEELRRWQLYFHREGKCHPAECRWCLGCPGHGEDYRGQPCCERAGEYNGFGSEPLLFRCPKNCSCHD